MRTGQTLQNESGDEPRQCKHRSKASAAATAVHLGRSAYGTLEAITGHKTCPTCAHRWLDKAGNGKCPKCDSRTISEEFRAEEYRLAKSPDRPRVAKPAPKKFKKKRRSESPPPVETSKHFFDPMAKVKVEKPKRQVSEVWTDPGVLLPSHFAELVLVVFAEHAAPFSVRALHDREQQLKARRLSNGPVEHAVAPCLDLHTARKKTHAE